MRSVADAWNHVDSGLPTGAVLNYRLDHDNAADLARALAHRGCRIVFLAAATGAVSEDLLRHTWLDKPIDSATMMRALKRSLL